ncbi:PHA/PHB synthase family protein [Teredinibacter haidensis]|uniref:PHA/PHB synthase family protein n=1 Tax=Teredinibacter haidensis TaxID=2731755 RepID=UPI000948A95E|nr:class I poly(R)-hydroxyalkanoic acid synthase [Teredinibacter haidensis]
MIEQERTEVLHYLNKFSGVFNDMMQEVIKRIIRSQFDGEFQSACFSSEEHCPAPKIPNVKVNAEQFVKQQMQFLEKQQELWQSATRAMMGEKVEPVIKEEKGDTRFEDKDWSGNPMFSYIKQAYLLNAEYMHQMVNTLEFDDKKLEEQVRFYTRQFISSVAPSNYVLTNPEVCREILSTEGENLAKGIDNFMRDLENSPSEAFKITQVNLDAFTLGVNLAYTPGKVIFQNRLIELIQYSPTTDNVFTNPLLIIPPFINKYYILDLDDQKSLVRWLVGQGYTVFMVSWVNPGEDLEGLTYDSYIEEGVVAALDVVESISQSDNVNVVGYCVGGTLLGMAQAYLLSKGDRRIQSLTFLTTLFDFSEPGEVGNYISEQMYPLIEKMVQTNGYFDGRILGLSFSLLRENNLFWSFFIENYLKGKDPTPFDILYWNSDSTNIPGPAYLYYLRVMYLENKLIQADGLEVKGVPIDLGKIKTPSYCLAAMADHIVLWPAAYRSAKCLGGKKRFVLTESGHVAGVVNPAAIGKYPHWVNDRMPKDHQQWLAGAKQQQGSWWNDWHRWLQQFAGEQRDLIDMGSVRYPVIGDAPGCYVKVRLEKVESDVADVSL